MGFNGDLYPTAGASVVMTTKGDMVDYNTERQRLGIGSTGQVLTVAGALPTWATLTTADSVLTTQGDILYESASGLARLGQSTDGFVLTTKGAGANPVWASAGGGATVTEVTDRNTGSKTTTSSTLVTADTNFSVTVPNITSGYCVVLANLCTQNSDSGSTATSAIYDVTNTAVLCANTTSTSSSFNNTQVITTDADGKELQIYISAPAGNTCYLLGQSGTGTSLENTCNLNVLGIG